MVQHSPHRFHAIVKFLNEPQRPTLKFTVNDLERVLIFGLLLLHLPLRTQAVAVDATGARNIMHEHKHFLGWLSILGSGGMPRTTQIASMHSQWRLWGYQHIFDSGDCAIDDPSCS